jgi:hypothetical protein
VGLGCGSQETSDPVVTTRTESEPARDRPFRPAGDAHVEYFDGRVTVRCDGSLQLAVLEQLAAQVGFEIVAGKTAAQPITLNIERAALVDAIALILDGFSYTLGYDLDEATGTRTLALIKIGETLEHGSANLAETASANARRIQDRVSSTAERTRGDQMDPASEGYSNEQAEMLLELDSSDPDARAEAVSWIELDPEVLERLISQLESDPDAEVRAAIVERLGEEESPTAMAGLVVALRDPDPEVVLEAMDILEFEAEALLIAELDWLSAHPEPDVRDAAQDAKDFLLDLE